MLKRGGGQSPLTQPKGTYFTVNLISRGRHVPVCPLPCSGPGILGTFFKDCDEKYLLDLITPNRVLGIVWFGINHATSIFFILSILSIENISWNILLFRGFIYQ